MAAPLEAGSYKEVILFLATAGIVVPLFSRLRLSPVLGFIGAGALIGPFGLGRFVADQSWLAAVTIPRPDEFAHLAELGVVFLLFTIGLELSWERLRTLRRLVFGLGGAQVVVSAVVLATIGLALGLPLAAAQIGGIALALSSTAIVIPILAAQKRLNSPTGRASFSVLLFQDLAVAPVLFTIAALGATTNQDSFFLSLVLSLGQAAVALVVIVVIGRLALRPLFQLVAQTGSDELFMAACFLTVIVAALAAAASGLSMALGAFIAGLLLAETEYRRAVESVVDPFKGLLLGVFFVSVGMGLDVTALGRAPVAIVLSATGIIAVKALIVFGLALVFRLPPRVGLEMGLLIGAGGEFAFVIVGSAASGGLIPADIAQGMLVVATVTMIVLPLLARVGRQLGRRVAGRATLDAPEALPEEEAGRVIVAGFGRVGQLVADMMDRHAVPYIAIDTSPALVAAQRASGKPVYFGDCSSLHFLNACGLGSARALVVTLDQPSVVQALVEAARRLRPDLTIVSRARDAKHARQLYALGVNDAVPETIEASLQLSEALLVDIGIATGPVIASIHERRDEFRRALQGNTASAGPASRSAETPRRSGEFRSRRTAGKRHG